MLISADQLPMLSFKRLTIFLLLFIFILLIITKRIYQRTDSSSTMTINFARRSDCNLHSRNPCDVSHKSLVITFWGRRSMNKWLITNLLLVFPEEYFDHLIMIYDNSSWITHPAYNKAIWIHVEGQIRFWFIKRFLSPLILPNYRYIWIVDDDARLHFNPLAYQCVADRYHLLLSSPGRLTGSVSYLFTRISPQYSEKVGRWTDFVETGPLVIFNASALTCLWKFISEKVSTGFGLDLIWCEVLRENCFREISSKKICAIVDSFAVDHVSDGIYTIDMGNEELPAYQKYYQKYQTKRQSFGSIDRDSTVTDSCREKYPIVTR